LYYVFIHHNANALENLAVIQPYKFANGYEYSRGGIHPKTLEEKEIVENYGGELLFTPGDVVYSSSALIENSPPNLTHHKLGSLMDAEGLTFGRLRDAVTTF